MTIGSTVYFSSNFANITLKFVFVSSPSCTEHRHNYTTQMHDQIKINSVSHSCSAAKKNNLIVFLLLIYKFRELEIYTRFVCELQYRRTTLVSHNTLHKNVLLGLALPRNNYRIFSHIISSNIILISKKVGYSSFIWYMKYEFW